ncbi:MAG TPA: AI-2E family transporter [Bacteroidales bacterium]|nr:AI-2E family transporter [Bacteroidales bacterium]
MKEDKYQFPIIARWVVSTIIILLVLYGVWYFRFLVVCIAIAIVLSFIARPLMQLLAKVSYKQFSIGNIPSTIITITILVSTIFLIIYTLVPMIISQAMSFANIDIYQIADYYAGPIKSFETFLYKYKIMATNTNLETLISNKILNMFQMFQINDIADILLSFGTSIIMGSFIIIFITFFLIKDAHLLYNFAMGITPDKYMEEVNRVITNTRSLISRYFIGISIEILLMISLFSIGFYFVGFSNVILVATICGTMVILPYIGVIIGGFMGLIITITGALSINPSVDILPIILHFLIVFGIVKIIDDFILQPFIYSKSVKAHPLEIFLIIIMAGEIGGVIGMILAIPTYTFLRIIAKEFFYQWKIVQTMTKDI